MKTVLVLIVLLIAGVAGLLTIKLSQEPVTWDMDPTRMIVPLDRPAVYAAAGEDFRAVFDFNYVSSATEREIRLGNYDLADPGLMGVDLDPSAVILLLNTATIYFYSCYLDASISDIAANSTECDAELDFENSSAFLTGARDLAKAMWLEANAWNRDAVATLYKDAGAQIGGALAGGISTYDDENRRKVAALARDFTFARMARLRLLNGDIDTPLIDGNSFNRWCGPEFDETCPGGLSTYRAIKLYLAGHHRDARTTALVALKGRQPWVYRSPYEHPLLWNLAASRHVGDDDDSDVQPLIDAALIEWPNDARVTLEVMIGDVDAAGPDDPMWTACTTPGCRFFLAEFFDAAGNAAMADAMALSGLALCDGVRSVLCTALRTFDSHTAMTGSP